MKNEKEIMKWHKFPDEEPPEGKMLLVAIIRFNEYSGTVAFQYFEIAGWDIYNGWSIDLHQNCYKCVSLWAEIPELPKLMLPEENRRSIERQNKDEECL